MILLNESVLLVNNLRQAQTNLCANSQSVKKSKKFISLLTTDYFTKIVRECPWKIYKFLLSKYFFHNIIFFFYTENIFFRFAPKVATRSPEHPNLPEVLLFFVVVVFIVVVDALFSSVFFKFRFY